MVRSVKSTNSERIRHLHRKTQAFRASLVSYRASERNFLAARKYAELWDDCSEALKNPTLNEQVPKITHPRWKWLVFQGTTFASILVPLWFGLSLGRFDDFSAFYGVYLYFLPVVIVMLGCISWIYLTTPSINQLIQYTEILHQHMMTCLQEIDIPVVEVLSCSPPESSVKPNLENLRAIIREQEATINLYRSSVDKLVDRGRVLDKLCSSFSLEELKTICLDLQMDHENLGGEGKTGMARELVTRCVREGRLSDLIRVCGVRRPRWLD